MGLAQPAPKAQPPRKRSGFRTAWELALWKAAACYAPLTDGGNFVRRAKRAVSREISQVLETEGAWTGLSLLGPEETRPM